ncbi:MAG: hypothetical protein R3C39_10240 [Dehalococcoidia bacterium]
MPSNPRIGRFTLQPEGTRAAALDDRHQHERGDVGRATHEHGHAHEGGTHGVRLEPGDLAFIVELRDGREHHRGAIVLDVDAGLLTAAFAHGVEVINMRALSFVRAWRVEHTPRSMTEDEAYAYALTRLDALRRSPLVVVDPGDEDAG